MAGSNNSINSPSLSNVATVNSAVLVTSSGGVATESTTLPSGLTIPGYAPLVSPTFTGTLNASVIIVSGLTTLSAGQIVAVTAVTGATYTTLATDFVITCNRSGTIAITLIASPVTGTTYRIKDISGNASSNNITITPTSGNIDNASNYKLTIDNQSIDVIYTGSQWSILG